MGPVHCFVVCPQFLASLSSNNGPDPLLLFSGTRVHSVPTFKYLGSTLSNTGNLKTQIDRRRRTLAASATQSLWRPLWGHRHICRETKLRVYNASVISVLLWGCETWPLYNNTLAARLDGFDSRALRRIEGISWGRQVSHKPGAKGPKPTAPSISPLCAGTAASSNCLWRTQQAPSWPLTRS